MNRLKYVILVSLFYSAAVRTMVDPSQEQEKKRQKTLLSLEMAKRSVFPLEIVNHKIDRYTGNLPDYNRAFVEKRVSTMQPQCTDDESDKLWRILIDEDVKAGDYKTLEEYMAPETINRGFDCRVSLRERSRLLNLLSYALRNGLNQLVQLLLTKNADVRTVDVGKRDTKYELYTPLYFALKNKRITPEIAVQIAARDDARYLGLSSSGEDITLYSMLADSTIDDDKRQIALTTLLEDSQKYGAPEINLFLNCLYWAPQSMPLLFSQGLLPDELLQKIISASLFIQRSTEFRNRQKSVDSHENADDVQQKLGTALNQYKQKKGILCGPVYPDLANILTAFHGVHENPFLPQEQVRAVASELS